MRTPAAIVQANAFAIPLATASVDLIVTSTPYFAFRSYRDGGEHFDGQLGSEDTPADFLVALWRVMDECWRVLKPTGVCFVNEGDKYAGSGGHNNGGIAKPRPDMYGNKAEQIDAVTAVIASRRQAPDRYNQSADVRAKSVMGIPWRFVLGLATPDPYRTIYDPGDHPQWINRRPLIWHKPNGLPESVNDRPHVNLEDWFMLTKQGQYFSALDELRGPYDTADREGPRWSYPAGSASGSVDADGEHVAQGFVGLPLSALGKVPGSVWTIAGEPFVVPTAVREQYGLPDHFAAFPQEWPRRLILGWTPDGICRACGDGRRPVVSKEAASTHSRGKRHIPGYEDAAGVGTRDVQYEIEGYACKCPGPTAPTDPAVVLDPFSGTGTTVGVARALGRTGVGLDLSSDYCRLAKWRVERSGHFVKTTNRTNAQRQGSLL